MVLGTLWFILHVHSHILLGTLGWVCWPQQTGGRVSGRKAPGHLLELCQCLRRSPCPADWKAEAPTVERHVGRWMALRPKEPLRTPGCISSSFRGSASFPSARDRSRGMFGAPGWTEAWEGLL